MSNLFIFISTCLNSGYLLTLLSLVQVAAQLNAMRDENRRVWDQLAAERRKVEKLVNVVGRLWDVVGKGFPGSGQFVFAPPRATPADSVVPVAPAAFNPARYQPYLNPIRHQSLNSHLNSSNQRRAQISMLHRQPQHLASHLPCQ